MIDIWYVGSDKKIRSFRTYEAGANDFFDKMVVLGFTIALFREGKRIRCSSKY